MCFKKFITADNSVTNQYGKTGPVTDFLKVSKIIESCITEAHLNSAQRMIDAFKRRWDCVIYNRILECKLTKKKRTLLNETR